MVSNGFVYAFTRGDHVKGMERARRDERRTWEEQEIRIIYKDFDGIAKIKTIKQANIYDFLNEYGGEKIISTTHIRRA